MSLTILIPIVIHTVTLACAILALWLAKRSYDTAPRKLHRELVEIMEEFDSRLVRLEGFWRKLNANYASLRAERSNGRSGPEEHEDETGEVDTSMRAGEDFVAYKQRMRKYLAQGKLKHAGD